MARLRFGPAGKTVAIIGPDGAGKSTLIDKLESELPYPLERIYMGINPDAATHALPTTRLVWSLKRRLKKRPRGRAAEAPQESAATEGSNRAFGRLARELKSAGFVAVRLSEQWYRQLACWYYQWRGRLVLLDRHFYLDYLATKRDLPGEQRMLAWRLHDVLIERLYPRPHLTIYLDAPAEVLYARKPETSLERLQTIRRVYRQIGKSVPCFEILDATQPAEHVFEATRQRIAAMLE